MHEIKLTQGLVELLNKAVEDPAVKDVKKVHIKVGKLHYIVPEIMQSAFESTPKNDKLKNAKLEIEVLPVILKCLECSKEYNLDDGKFNVECCENARSEIISGKEFILEGIEY